MLLRIKVMLIVLLSTIVVATGCFAGVIDEIRAAQKGVKSVSASFKQEKTSELLGRPIRSKGKFYFKADKGVRWDYKDAMVIIYDGKSLYLHYTELDRAEKIDGVEDYVGPLAFEIDAIVKDYHVKAMSVDGMYKLVLTPKTKRPFANMRMTFKAGSPLPDEVEIVEELGDKTVIKFEKVKVGAVISDSKFILSLPKGVKLQERRYE